MGPCALCRVMICASDDCSRVVEERGLPKVVLCADCMRYRSPLASSERTAPLMALTGAVLLMAMVHSGGASWLAALGYTAAALLLLLSAAMAIARWQWRARLGSARPPGEREQ